MLAAIITVLGSWALKAFQWCFGGKQQAAGVAQGKAEAQRDQAVVSANTEAAIAVAAVNAPRTKEQVEERLSNGTF